MKNWLLKLAINHKAVPMVFDWLNNLKNSAAGKKTYLLGGAMVLYGAVGYYLGALTEEQAADNIKEGLAFCFLRAGISKLGK